MNDVILILMAVGALLGAALALFLTKKHDHPADEAAVSGYAKQ